MRFLAVSLIAVLAACETPVYQSPDVTPPPLGEPTDTDVPQIVELCEAEPESAVCKAAIKEQLEDAICETPSGPTLCKKELN